MNKFLSCLVGVWWIIDCILYVNDKFSLAVLLWNIVIKRRIGTYTVANRDLIWVHIQHDANFIAVTS